MRTLHPRLLFLAGVAWALKEAVSNAATDGNCQRPYTVQSGDSCIKICSQKSVTYAQLLAWNPGLNPSCSNLASFVNNSLCLSNPRGQFSIIGNTLNATAIATTTAPVPSPTLDETTSRCAQYHLVSAGDDCSLLTTKFGITLKDFIFLNPEVWSNCTNLELGFYYCIQPVGYISTYPGYAPTPTPEPFNQTDTVSLPYIGNPWDSWPSSDPIIPIANGTRRDCYDYHWTSINNLTENSSADCWSVAMLYGITNEELILWNPSLGQGQDDPSLSPFNLRLAAEIASPSAMTDDSSDPYTYSCVIATSVSYCVLLASPTSGNPSAPTMTAPPSPRASGEVSNCTNWYQPTIAAGDSCGSILGIFQLSMDQFYAMNPSVRADCSILVFGTYYCISTEPDGGPPGNGHGGSPSPTKTTSRVGTGIATPSPIQTGVTSSCKKFYKVQTGDGCFAIAQANGIALDDFYSWNPAVKTDCSGLQADIYVCVGISATTTTTTPTSTSKPTGVVTPTPTQTGMVGNCDKFYDVKGGDGCSNIAQANSIPLDSFYAWNPAVKTDCSGLQANVYVCVGISTTTSAMTTPKPTGVATPTPTQTGMVSNCNKFYDVHSGDGCAAIASNEGIPLATFYAWNPAVKTDCSGLQANVYVCVGVSNSAPAVVTPTPTQSGMVAGCDSYYDVRPGDGCWDIANKEGIDLSSLYKWNPAVKTDCTGLQPSVYICIGVE